MERVGKYELIRELGGGAMGVVYLARDVALQREVALKRLRVTSDRALARFAVEAQAVARLQHQGIVKLHEAQLDGPQPFLVMSYVAGESLQARLDRDGTVAAEEAVALTIQLADALAHAHEQGVLHRDVKPGNVLIGDDGRAYLVDFGLAQDLEGYEALTQTGQIVGTPAFMAPEQATGNRRAFGPATDVYGLGATLYAMLSGRAPHERMTLMALVAAVTQEEPARLSSFVPGLDHDLEAIVYRCLEKQPGDRFATATALAEALRSGEAPPSPRRIRRRRVIIGMALGALASLLLAVVTMSRTPSPVEPGPASGPVPPRSASASAPPPFDPVWRKALFRMDDDPIKAWELVADARGEPSPQVARRLAHLAESRLPLVTLGARSDWAKWLACARLRMRVNAAPLPSSWLRPVLRGVGFVPAQEEPFVREMIDLFAARHSAGAAEVLIRFVDRGNRRQRLSWLKACTRLADKIPLLTEEWTRAQLLILDVLGRVDPPIPSAAPEVRERAQDLSRRAQRVLLGEISAKKRLAAAERALAARAGAAASLRLSRFEQALRTANHGWRDLQDLDCLGLMAATLYHSNERTRGVALAMTYLKSARMSRASRYLYRRLLGMVWDEGGASEPALPGLLAKVVRVDRSLHGWRLRQALLDQKTNRGISGALLIKSLKVDLRAGKLLCVCAEEHARMLALPERPSAELELLVKDLDRTRRKSGYGLP